MTTIACFNKELFSDSKKVLNTGDYESVSYGKKLFLCPGIAFGVSGDLGLSVSKTELVANFILNNIHKHLTGKEFIGVNKEKEEKISETNYTGMFNIKIGTRAYSGQFISIDKLFNVTDFKICLTIGSGESMVSMLHHGGFKLNNIMDIVIKEDPLSGGKVQRLCFSDINQLTIGE